MSSIACSRLRVGITLLTTALLATPGISCAQEISYAQPKLILQITVDQLRGDLPTRYYDRLGDGGFRYLWENGIVYRNAYHAHANTETIVGHATLATGAHRHSNSPASDTARINVHKVGFPVETDTASSHRERCVPEYFDRDVFESYVNCGTEEVLAVARNATAPRAQHFVRFW